MAINLERYGKLLKPCPFCGEDNRGNNGDGVVYMEHIENRGRVCVMCTSCGANMSREIRPDKDTAMILVEAWNRRES